MTPNEIAHDQRHRLEEAMIEAAARHGYAGTTLSELASLAGVSKSTFYEHFETKEDCFWATYEGVVDEATSELRKAYLRSREAGQSGQLRAAFAAHARWLVARPTAGSLLLVESLCLGAPGAHRREAAAKRFEETLRACYAEAPERGDASEMVVRGAIGGYRHFAYRSLRAQRPQALARNADQLADWMLGYQRPERERLLPSSFFEDLSPALARSNGDAGDGELPGWQEPPDSRRSRRALTQRQRIIRAMARLAAKQGYASLSVPAISAEAGVSNQTFYQEFRSKQEAFLAAIEELSERALGHAGRAFAAQDDWRRAIGAAVWALVCLAVAEPYFGRLAFFEVSAAGPVGLDRADAIMDRFGACLSRQEPAVGAPALPRPVLEAICGGIWRVIATELSHARTDGLCALVPELADFALLPFEEAAEGGAQA